MISTSELSERYFKTEIIFWKIQLYSESKRKDDSVA